MIYSLKLHDGTKKDLNQLDNNLRLLVFKKLKKLQQNPDMGLPLGNKANFNLSGFKKIYVSAKKVRIVYKIENDILSIFIIAIGKRDDMEVYKKASKRI